MNTNNRTENNSTKHVHSCVLHRQRRSFLQPRCKLFAICCIIFADSFMSCFFFVPPPRGVTRPHNPPHTSTTSSTSFASAWQGLGHYRYYYYCYFYYYYHYYYYPLPPLPATTATFVRRQAKQGNPHVTLPFRPHGRSHPMAIPINCSACQSSVGLTVHQAHCPRPWRPYWSPK